MTARYRLRAFIYKNGHVEWTPDEGFSAFVDIWRRRPLDCNLCVVETVKGEFLLTDILDATWKPEDYSSINPVPMLSFGTVDAAVMAGVIH